MRRVTLLFVLVLMITGAVLVAVARPDLLARVGLGGSTGMLSKITRAFLEDIQFKDFVKAATYHAPDKQDSVDIPYLLERLFAIKPEFLDVMDYEIVFVKIDSSGLRARVKTMVKVKDLVQGKIRERELMLYFHRDTLRDPWYMKLESSLHSLEADKGKKH